MLAQDSEHCLLEVPGLQLYHLTGIPSRLLLVVQSVHLSGLAPLFEAPDDLIA